MRFTPVLDKAITNAADVLRGVKPDQLDAPTPCADWTVRALVNHLLQAVSALTLAGEGRPVPGDLWGRDLMAEGWAARFEEQARAASAAWARPDAWDRAVDLGGMPMPASMAAAMLLSDFAIHGWDLARATGQEYRCDDDVAEATYQFVVDMGDQGRQMGIYGAPVPAGDGAPAFERALALSGRDPHWAR